MEKKVADELAGIKSYHDDNDGGLDDFNVGHSLGAGAMAPYSEKSGLALNENFLTSKLLDNGPLRISFELTYADLATEQGYVGEKRIISLDAGSQLTKIQQIYSNKAPMTVAAGIVRVAGDTPPVTDLQQGYMIYAQPKTAKTSNVYPAVLLPEGIKAVVENQYKWFNPVKKVEASFAHYLALSEAAPETPVTYYTGYGWAEWGFPTLSDFETYVQHFAQALKEPLEIKFEK